MIWLDVLKLVVILFCFYMIHRSAREWAKASYERGVLRGYILGKFRDRPEAMNDPDYKADWKLVDELEANMAWKFSQMERNDQ
jgi:hypothetical protein